MWSKQDKNKLYDNIKNLPKNISAKVNIYFNQY